MGGRQVPFRRQSCLLVRALLLWIACKFICSSQGFAGLDAWKLRVGTGKTTGRCRPSNWWNERPGNSTDCLAQRTKDAFETYMKDAGIPLLETWESYEASLPVREGSDGVSKLYLQPYLCRSKELDVAVSRLEAVNKDRDRVAYLSAPTKRGKSAAILPIFCRSVELSSGRSFTHYLYMPFANNGRNRHSPARQRLLLSLETDELERAGADFMLHCFRMQMNGEYHDIEWQLPRPLPGLRTTEAKFAEEVEKFLQRNASNRLLLHIDEHRSMSTSPEFRRGALLLAGSLPQMCQVIATYLEPPDLAAQGSSQVCRFPIAMMLVDVSPLLTRDVSQAAPATAMGLPKIKLPSTGWGGNEKRLLATLRVKLSLFLVHIGLDQLHIPQDEKSDLRRTFRNIQDQLDKEGNLESKLIGALGSFSLTLPDLDEQVSGAVDLLLGIKDARAEGRRYPGVISLENQKLTLSLETLMAVGDARDKASPVFRKAQKVFRSSLMRSGSWCDGMLLERAYLWVLACKAAKAEDGFGFQSKDLTFEFQCKDIRDGLEQVDGKNARVFTKKGDPCIDGICCIEAGVMYHALSEGGKAGTHKGFDIWFKTKADELVLLDVTRATNAKTCNEKASNIAQNVNAVKQAVQHSTSWVRSVSGILLAPNCNSPTVDEKVVAGDAARDILGGLQQLVTWLGDDVD